MSIDLENCNRLSPTQTTSCLAQLKEQGFDMADIRAIWFQADKSFVELKMHDGTRQKQTITFA